MEIGDKVKCIEASGYHFTTGKVYEVIGYQPSERIDHFTWPAYMQVKDDSGNEVWCHTTRFRKED